MTVVQRNAGWTVKTGGKDAPLNTGESRIFGQRLKARRVVHEVGGGVGAVVGVHPKHPIGGGVGDVEDTRVMVKFHVARNPKNMAELNIGIPVHDGVGVVVVARVVVLSKVVANQFAVMTVVVPVHVIVVMSDARAVGRFVVHVDVAAEQVVVLILHSVVVKGGRPKRRPHEVVT